MCCVWHQVISHQHPLNLSKWLRYQMYQIQMLDVILIDTTHQRLPQGHLCMVAAMVCIFMNLASVCCTLYFQETSFIIQFVCHHFCFYFSGGAKTLGIFQVFLPWCCWCFFFSYIFITKGGLINWSVCNISKNLKIWKFLKHHKK